MKKLTFQVLDGVDKGRVYKDLPIPVTIGREEGNILRLSDDRISRFHAKVQQEDEDIILIDLESTNGTKINGSPVQIRRIRPGDQISLGRSVLLYGTLEEIANRKALERNNGRVIEIPSSPTLPGTVHGDEADFHLPNQYDSSGVSADPITWANSQSEVPPLPQKLSPSQAARLSEIFDYLHIGISCAVERAKSNEDGNDIHFGFDEWQAILAVQNLLAQYMRKVADPDA